MQLQNDVQSFSFDKILTERIIHLLENWPTLKETYIVLTYSINVFLEFSKKGADK